MGEDGARVVHDADFVEEKFSLMDHDVLDDMFDDGFDDEDDYSSSVPSSTRNSDSGGGGGGVREDEEFCEVAPSSRYRTDWNKDSSCGGSDNVIYAPDRAPPLMDFLTVITAFVVAVFAAYYSISL